MDFDKLSRRNFIKTTTVLAVGVASVGLFAGLVDAADGAYPYARDPLAPRCRAAVPHTKYRDVQDAVEVCWVELGCVDQFGHNYYGVTGKWRSRPEPCPPPSQENPNPCGDFAYKVMEGQLCAP